MELQEGGITSDNTAHSFPNQFLEWKLRTKDYESIPSNLSELDESQILGGGAEWGRIEVKSVHRTLSAFFVPGYSMTLSFPKSLAEIDRWHKCFAELESKIKASLCIRESDCQIAIKGRSAYSRKVKEPRL